MSQKIINNLRAWKYVEFLEPIEIDTKRNDIDIIDIRDDHSLPWKSDDYQEDDTYTFIHRLFIGVFDIKEELKFAKEAFGEEELHPNLHANNAKSALAVIEVNSKGAFIDDSLFLPTMPFGISKIKDKKHNEDWSKAFTQYKEEMQHIAAKHLKGTLDGNALNQFLQSLQNTLSWKPELYHLPLRTHTVKVKKEKKNPEDHSNDFDPLLNSFFIHDLEAVEEDYKKGSVGNALHQYMSGASDLLDIDDDRETIEKVLSPEHIPLAKWPDKDEHHLSLMQQFAVNSMFMEDSPHQNLYTVNGPPGTGKTTLLKDVMAENVFRRASKMVQFKNPEDAFTRVKAVKPNDNFIVHVQQIDESLTGYGMVVASSNNTAVQNISEDLPNMGSIDEKYQDHPGASYFRKVINGEDREAPDHWGFFSGVLGNSKNRSTFAENYIWPKSNDKDEQINFPFHHFLEDRSVTIADWEKAKVRFQNAWEKAKKEQKQAIEAKDRVTSILKAKALKEKENQNIKELETTLLEHQKEQMQSKETLESLLSEIEEQEELKKELDSFTFSWWDKLFRTSKVKENAERKNVITERLYKCKEEKLKLNKTIKQRKAEISSLEKEIESSNQELKQAEEQLYAYYQEEHFQERTIMDDSFWTRSHEEKQKSSPWMTIKFAKARANLFLEAMHIHETFLCCANKKAKNCISGYSNLKEISTRHPELVKPIWESFFLFVPVISTAFASLGTMFRGLGKEELDWLFIDEAGQATPQMAVGGIWRSKHTVAVGDPKQIEPVVTMPASLFDDLAKHFQVPDSRLSPLASVQSVADLGNPYGKNLDGTWIGSPLWVHRRCVEPMFTIANKAAYEEKMVLATIAKQSSPPHVTSDWIQVKGQVEDQQYVPAQGEKVLETLHSIVEQNGGKLPDLYIISPFKRVADKVKALLREEWNITGVTKKERNTWIRNSVGTVHTFQGKEAETVLFCLGVDSTKRGAAEWATSKPNIINVAATRAKRRFYVIGDKEIWADLSYMDIVRNEINKHKESRIESSS
ncbi:AAA domain-containing protein [Halobacillus sp. BAB-2008]|uniref:DEAD/DEAH box helicase n=1 Tax=Halobacillus sp. BAB-2008 TaxID=1246484 RepID=UPI0002A4FC09|nr:AAA domain-containing protein [Halobacillus sp. BAB-2008]ELK48599.1 hypothetical protein D479_02357 [Halobacillus sp. BAB-2008]